MPDKKRIFSTIYVFLFCLLGSVGCKFPGFTEPETFGFDLIYVNDIVVPDTSLVDDSLDIVVKGDLPNPSWSFDHFELFQEGLSLSVTPIGKQRLNVTAAQVLVSFQETVSFTPTEKGAWTIKAVGKNDTIQTQTVII